MLEFRLAKKRDLEIILSLYNRTKNDLLKNNILQWGTWGDGYPNRDFIKDRIRKKELFVLTYYDKIIGSVSLNQEQSIEWNIISWEGDIESSLLIHAMIIDPTQQGNGYGSKLLEYCENYAKNQGLKYIRLDAFTKNKISNKLYLTRDYKNLGTVIFRFKPENNQEYYCYEKEL
ncbi:MAG: GNAT family N-acetyltransferase [Candidatus Lokiarchaeota archaeon]|nr:GNAT family N-acetyltransferase [Candidatus Lokiarchaeota archaeon]